MHTTMVPKQVKPQKIQAGVQVSRLEDKDVIFSIRSALDVILLCRYVAGSDADGAQSSRVPVPLPDDPYVAVRQAQLVDTDTESDPEEAPSEAEESQPLGSRVHLTDEEFEASKPSDSAFYKTSYETLSPSPSLTLPVRKRYRGTSELILDTDSEGDELGDEDTDEDGEDESSDADDERESLEDEGHGLDDEGHGLDDEGHGLDDEGHGLDDEGHGLDDEGHGLYDEYHGLDDEGHGLDDEDHGLEDKGLGLEEEDEDVPESQQQAVPATNTAVGEPLGLGYGALRRRELAVE
ncbi:hypothetical protein Tco_0691584, partial [Tanacetum coccineum]